MLFHVPSTLPDESLWSPLAAGGSKVGSKRELMMIGQVITSIIAVHGKMGAFPLASCMAVIIILCVQVLPCWTAARPWLTDSWLIPLMQKAPYPA